MSEIKTAIQYLLFQIHTFLVNNSNLFSELQQFIYRYLTKKCRQKTKGNYYYNQFELTIKIKCFKFASTSVRNFHSLLVITKSRAYTCYIFYSMHKIWKEKKEQNFKMGNTYLWTVLKNLCAGIMHN